MRTADEIVAKMRETTSQDLFGTFMSDLLEYLPFEQAREWLNTTVTADAWAKAERPRALTDETVLAEIKGYMAFAWSKANDCRGLSAARSLLHMKAWLWLLGEDEAAERVGGEYDLYGKPHLRAICEHYGVDWQSLDDGAWRENEGGRGFTPQPATELTWKAVP